MKNRRKAYLTSAELEYVAAAKRYLAAILAEKDINESQLEAMTGIPVSTLSRWLSQDRGEFMTLADAALICRAIGIDVQAMLPPATWDRSNPESSEMVVFLMGIPLPHLRWLADTYEKGVVALRQ
ncbi:MULTISPECIES: helix-turn-helix domain-containing protein [Aeromonas]|uniref:helix-turn-helix domain-containing protein n=1 Tax=Aeromonas TaxID=642 RepID=UPI001F4AE6C1|nr:helix-turn-helix transcriptional regulator [Aeromonas sp. MR7]MCH7348608.1 helix-turn-helix transcriptional regulator [Aeromonas sp. MR7]